MTIQMTVKEFKAKFAKFQDNEIIEIAFEGYTTNDGVDNAWLEISVNNEIIIYEKNKKRYWQT